jgi:hypothetical protein
MARVYHCLLQNVADSVSPDVPKSGEPQSVSISQRLTIQRIPEKDRANPLSDGSGA